MKGQSRPTRTIFTIPAAIGASSLLGLFLGLTGDGLGDLFAWLLVGLAPFTMAAVLLRRSPN
ncbi:hypothetical protein K3181_09590 [Qipengyuania sp. YG27]|uniref:Uncharacterized protein n=1 Tax=Qipengyuania mesophila TaxID=2867246 RepID=A0ABS7JVL6_9SPHN|nr:hypothetical protein [Qipengyuania mesophila]MBX7501694.1 hypothetical protein [Qipengyuania mesophila]